MERLLTLFFRPLRVQIWAPLGTWVSQLLKPQSRNLTFKGPNQLAMLPGNHLHPPLLGAINSLLDLRNKR